MGDVLVARRVVNAIRTDRKGCYIGFLELLFVRVNALLPRLIDAARVSKKRIMGRFVETITAS